MNKKLILLSSLVSYKYMIIAAFLVQIVIVYILIKFSLKNKKANAQNSNKKKNRYNNTNKVQYVDYDRNKDKYKW